MSLADVAEQSLKGGDPVAALAQLQEQVRAKPADPKLRIFLFQLLCVLGQWERALNQLNVASNLDPEALAMAQTYGDAVQCEAVRDDVFDGKKSPMIFGQPEQWLALLIESLLLAGRGEHERSQAAAIAGLRRSPDLERRHRWTAVRLDLRRRFAAGPGARGGDQRPLLLGALLPFDQDRARTAGRPARSWSGCRRACSSRTAASRWRSFRLAIPGRRRPRTA